MMAPAFSYPDQSVQLYHGDARSVMRAMAAESVQCVVTSPPYWGLRDYDIAPLIWDGEAGCAHDWSEERVTSRRGSVGERSTLDGSPAGGASRVDKQPSGAFCRQCGAWRGSLGLEPTYLLFIAHLVEIFRELRRVLRRDGTLWLNMGDSYATGAGQVGFRPGGGWEGDRWQGHKGSRGGSRKQPHTGAPVGPLVQPNRLPQPGLKAKDLVGMPWRVALALQDDGWYLRRDIIWAKPNPMPESCKDRPTTAHEYLFLLTRSPRYYYDWEAIKEQQICPGDSLPEDMARSLNRRRATTPVPRQDFIKVPSGWETGPGEHGSFHRLGREGVNSRMHQDRDAQHGKARKARTVREGIDTHGGSQGNGYMTYPVEYRNKRSVWEVPTQAYKGAHFATFPEALVTPCILAGSRHGDVVYDPFAGSGTTLAVARRLGRAAWGSELNPAYIAMARKRIDRETPAMRFDDEVQP